MEIKPGKVLLIDDDEDILQAAGCFSNSTSSSSTPRRIPRRSPRLLKNETYDVIFLDMNFAPGATDGAGGAPLAERILDARSARPWSS